MAPNSCARISRQIQLAVLFFVIVVAQLDAHGYHQHPTGPSQSSYDQSYPIPENSGAHHYKQNSYQYEQYAPQSQYNGYYRPEYQAPPPAYNPGYKKYYKQYLPGPQICPDTGRTVCNKLSSVYPIDDIYSVVKMARAKRFNISSEFVDESQNDSEPHFEPMPEPEPVFHQMPTRFRVGNGFVVHPNPDAAFNTLHGGGGHGGHDGAHIHNFDFKYPGNSEKTAPPSRGRGYYRGRYKRQAANPNTMEPICRSRIILIEPKAAMNDKSEWKFVVNLSERDPRLKQAIKVEVCAQPNSPCSNQVSLPFGFISRCRQKYIKKKLMSLDANGQSISSENFFAPSCCVCEVIRDTQTSAAAAASNINEQAISIISPTSSSSNSQRSSRNRLNPNKKR